MKFLAGAVISLVLVSAIAVAYFVGKGQKEPAVQPSPQATTVAQTLSEPEAPPKADTSQNPKDFVNPSATIAAIEEAIPGKDYKALSAYMVSNVNVILYASECCGLITKAAAIEQLKYLNGATSPWNFDMSNPIASQLAEKAPQYFKDAVIGTSANNYAVGFVLDDKFLIKSIVLVADYKLITNP